MTSSIDNPEGGLQQALFGKYVWEKPSGYQGSTIVDIYSSTVKKYLINSSSMQQRLTNTFEYNSGLHSRTLGLKLRPVKWVTWNNYIFQNRIV